MKLSAYILFFLFSVLFPAKADDSTINGQPISSAISQDDAAQYVDHVVQNWVDAGKSDANGNIKPDQIYDLANGIKPLGLSNLLGCYKALHQVPPDASPAPKERIKERVLAKGISLDAGADDIDALSVASADQPLILAVFLDHSEWDSNPKVITFVSTALGTIQDIYKKSNLAPRYLLELAVRNRNPGMQSALQALITDASQNQSNYKNGHLYPDLIAKIAQHPTPDLEKSLPDLIQIDADLVETSPSDRYNGISVSDGSLNSELYGGLAGLIIAKPTLCSDPKTKVAFIKLNDKLSNGGGTIMSLLIPAAASGDKSALTKIVASYKTAPGKDAFADKYLKTIVCQKLGTNLAEVINHADSAVYNPDTCLWTVSMDDKAPN